MAGNDLFSVCNVAYTTVFLVLGILAIVIYLITILFPGRQDKTDAALVAAVTGTVATLFPQAQVTKIEEE